MPSSSPEPRTFLACWFRAGVLSLLSFGAVSPGLGSDLPPDLAEFKTVETAQKTTLNPATEGSVGLSGYLGVDVEANSNGQLSIVDVAAGSPAKVAGLQRGDRLRLVDKQSVGTVDEFRNVLLAHVPGETVTLGVERDGQPLTLAASLAAQSHPKKLAERRAVLGLGMAATESEDGIAIRSVQPDSPAAVAGLKPGDVLVKVNDASLGIALAVTDALADKEPGDTVHLTYRRDGAESQVTVKLAPSPTEDTRNNAPPPLPPWKKDTYRLAVVPIEFPDVKHNDAIPTSAWEEMLFSSGTYAHKNNITGQPVFGSLHDYYQEISVGHLNVSGHVFDWVPVSKTRPEYPQLPVNPRLALFTEALDQLLKREGDDCLKDVDGLIFLYAGDRFRTTNRGSVFWPHRSSVKYRGKMWPYLICPEGGKFMANISVFCHEFGHMLGLPDLYARPENPGSEGVGAWSLMSQQTGGGQPQHMCAWCKERLDWLKPAVLDPAVKQKLILSPVEGTDNQCFKIPMRADGSEYLLLENRRRQGFDQRLPGEGLMIWHVVGKHPVLEESHGVDGPAGPLVFLKTVPYPSDSNDSFTPYTVPSSRSQLGGRKPIYITNIRRLPDGRITFYLGYVYE
ncbi:MAG: M6 family metalloprotease domain-containing protein [Chthoniobacter sp.]|uniref:M6 family metalloprotease domain-containing protein n=1 Tax=Chthoniobacter sp. TaxID=2510640 RepID=UPI0032A54BC8